MTELIPSRGLSLRALAVAIGWTSVCIAGVPPMFPTPEFDTGRRPAAIAVGDVDRDGRPDVVLANPESGDVTVMLGDGQGNLGAPSFYPVGAGGAVGDEPLELAVADFDGDGRLDVLTANGQGQSVSFLKGLAGPGVAFAPATTIPIGAPATAISTGDLDGDGDLDAVVSSSANTTTALFELLSNGAGTFVVKPVATGFAIVAARIADVTGDALPDVVAVSIAASPGVATFVQHPGGQLALDGVQYYVGLPPYAAFDLCYADFNGDARAEVIVATHTALYILRNTGVPGAWFASSSQVPSGCERLQTIDWTGDGTLDLVATGDEGYTTGNPARLLVGNGFGEFTPSRVLAAHGHGMAADMNRDGRLDVVTAYTPPSSLGTANGFVTIALQDSLGRFGGAPLVMDFVSGPFAGYADVDLDGDPDGVSFKNTAKTTVERNDGLGNFAPGPSSSLQTSNWFPKHGYLGDFTNDGVTDLVGSQGQSMGTAAGAGDGTFGSLVVTQLFFGSGNYVYHNGVVADVDVDGGLDVVLYRTELVTNSKELFVMRGNGVGGFVAATGIVSGALAADELAPFDVADLNGDGMPDLVYSASSSGGSGRIGSALATSLAPLHFAASTFSPLGIPFPSVQLVARDLDGDGVEDLAIVHPSTAGANPSATIRTLKGNGSGGFSNLFTAPLGTLDGDVDGLDVADFDGDGVLDLAAAASVPPNVQVFRGTGGGVFSSPLRFAVETTYQHELVAVDLDQDGRPDVAGGGEPFVLEHYAAPAPCAGSFVEYGSGCYGNGHFTLHLQGEGCPSPGATLGFTISGASNYYGPSSGVPAIVFLGASPASLPLGHGCSFLVTPLALTIALPIVGSGIGGAWAAAYGKVPAGAPTGVAIYLQAFVETSLFLEPSPWGYGSSNGLRIDVN